MRRRTPFQFHLFQLTKSISLFLSTILALKRESARRPITTTARALFGHSKDSKMLGSLPRFVMPGFPLCAFRGFKRRPTAQFTEKGFLPRLSGNMQLLREGTWHTHGVMIRRPRAIARSPLHTGPRKQDHLRQIRGDYST